MTFKAYVFLSVLAVLASLSISTCVAIRVASYRGHELKQTQQQLADLQVKTATYDDILTTFIIEREVRHAEQKETFSKLDALTDDVCFPASLSELWNSYCAASTSGASSALATMPASTARPD